MTCPSERWQGLSAAPRPASQTLAKTERTEESNALPLLLVSAMEVVRARAVQANPGQPDELSTLLKCHNAVDSPSRRASRCLSRRALMTQLYQSEAMIGATLLSFYSPPPLIYSPPPTQSHLERGLHAPSSTVEAAEGGGADCGRGFEV